MPVGWARDRAAEARRGSGPSAPGSRSPRAGGPSRTVRGQRRPARQANDRRDLLAVQVLELQTFVEALDDAVGLGGVMAGPDVMEIGMTGDQVDEVGALVRGAAVGDDRQWLGAVVGQRDSEEPLRVAVRELDRKDSRTMNPSSIDAYDLAYIGGDSRGDMIS